MSTFVKLVSYSSTNSDSGKENVETHHVKKGKKRVRKEDSWKKNIAKDRRQKGEYYITRKNKIVKSRNVKASCGDFCKNHCSTFITECIRKQIHYDFWKKTSSWNGKKQFISDCVVQKGIKRHRPRKESPSVRTISKLMDRKLKYVYGSLFALCQLAKVSYVML
jgi:hypothetical protein